MPGILPRTRRPKRAKKQPKLTKDQRVHPASTDIPPQSGQAPFKQTRHKPLPPIPPETKFTSQTAEGWHAFKWELERHDVYLTNIIEQMHKAPDKTSNEYKARVDGVRKLRRDVFELGESGRHALVGSRAIIGLAERTLMVVRNMYQRTVKMTPNMDGTPISPPVLKLITDLSNECKKTSLPVKISNTMTLRRNMEQRYLDTIEKRILDMNTILAYIVHKLKLRDKMIYQSDQWPVEAVITWREEIHEAKMSQRVPKAQQNPRREQCLVQ
ncbi:hypothetical protein L198_01658 [Cryptococcus wingfieldii CBS 7118]|uniref:Uncharacterized protein n=1 Tax=Cryptococcus wingfieldii CBS 7118 TaxID=1295528 RepID=A0A1E3K043_9TREE|nr:hypothetical protein L198_01658 [Cryptococcus wingfieldii CBS 7118]ODO06426.1 hypothetical protein L198_01658 [Cryptococcus wingfieldii CBS 7118]